MKNTNKKNLKRTKKQKLILHSTLLLVLILLGTNGATQVNADNNMYPPIVKRLAQKFDVNEADVEEVFAQERAEEWNKKRQTLSEELGLAVKYGKLTEEQKQKILDKKDELQADHETQREQTKNYLKEWMIENNIDPNILMPYLGFGNFRQMRFNHKY